MESKSKEEEETSSEEESSSHEEEERQTLRTTLVDTSKEVEMVEVMERSLLTMAKGTHQEKVEPSCRERLTKIQLLVVHVVRAHVVHEPYRY